MLRRHHCIINYQKMKSNVSCSLRGPVVLWESIGGGRLQYAETNEGEDESSQFTE